MAEKHMLEICHHCLFLLFTSGILNFLFNMSQCKISLETALVREKSGFNVLMCFDAFLIDIL